MAHYLWLLRRHRWRILAFVAASVVATAVISARLTPLYEATATIDVDREAPSGIVGEEALRIPANDADQFLATQIKLIQSDSVLRPVAEAYRLRELEGWDAREETVRSGRAAQAPVVLKRLKVTRPTNTYLLLISYRAADPKLAADVANAIAHSYLEHTYKIRFRSSASLSAFMEKQLEELKAKMERSSAALAQFERELNVIHPEEKTSILSARLLQLNTEYTNAQAERLRREAAWQSVRDGDLEAAQASSQGESLRRLVERLQEAQENFARVRAHYGANHPEYRKAAAQLGEIERLIDQTRRNIRERVQIEYEEALRREQMLQGAVNETKAEFDRLNARSFEYQALKREAEADKKLYEELVRKIKEAGINASFQDSSIRLADPARPPVKPVFPKMKLNLALAFLFSLLIAVGAAVVSDALDDTVRDPEQVARLLAVDVIGTLPVVKDWRGRPVPVAARTNGKGVALTPADAGAVGYDESIRTLRNSILLVDFERRLRSLLITSAAPGEGKSTIAVHLALAHAGQRRRTLLIDGDLRRPSVHRRFDVPAAPGLSSVLLGEVSWRQAIVPAALIPELDLLPAGPPSRRAPDLVGDTLAAILEEAARHYDLILLDGPPLLGFAEPLEMARAVDGVIVIARAGETSRKAVGSVLTALQRLRAGVLGVVLNEVGADVESYYHYKKYYRYYRQTTL
ncbi:MAG: polysaccharide biosynthesis tyrosine autokinase [Bryobacterales bacterium]|nr:polysaccharide biosynthesis tyrosine autokinase [Bryobacteraceae bacterium]MDW8355187.1 polysaccharide biosynthesis tyrosine autokinase [Bryobacterales bacterium]